MSKILNRLVISLRSQMGELGFKSDKSTNFIRDKRDRLEMVLLGERKDAFNAEDKCGVNVGIRFPQIEAILDPDGADGICPTLGMPIHLLTEKRLFLEWPLNMEMMEETRDDVVFVIRGYALPFFDSFTSLRTVAECLLQEDPSNWFCMTPTRRTEVLTACLVALDDADAARNFLERQVELNRDKLPKYRVPLQLLRQRLFS